MVNHWAMAKEVPPIPAKEILVIPKVVAAIFDRQGIPSPGGSF